MSDNMKVNENAWVTKVQNLDQQGLVIDMPADILTQLNLQPGDRLLWTLLPNNYGFTVNKVADTFKETV